jgi:hypothetical protein
MLSEYFKTNLTLCFNQTNKVILDAAEQAYREILGPTWEQFFCVTGGLEGSHAATSKHYYNAGLDFRTGHDWPQPLMHRPIADKIAARMQALLGPGFFVQVEDRDPDRIDGHIHAQATFTLPTATPKRAA